MAFERDEQRRSRIAENALAFGVTVDVCGDAPEAFDEAVFSDRGVDGVPRPSAIFIGGGLTQPGLLEACYERLPTAGAWSSTPSPLNPKPFSRRGIPDVGGELRRFQHYRGEPVGGIHRLATRDARHPVGR